MNSQLTWMPSASNESLIKRAQLIQTIRHFFQTREILEVETPILSHYGITDVHLSTFKTSCYPPDETHSLPGVSLSLITSPEYHMKRLLAAGSGSIFQLTKCFRNHEESSRYHNPEFTMLEWYHIGFDMMQLINEVNELFQLILNCPPSEQASYQSLFIQYCSIDPLTATLDELQQIIKGLNIGFDSNESDRDTLLQVIFTFAIEPYLGKSAPIAVYHFPASQAALAKIDDQDPRVANRFEFYYQGIELANGFQELTNAEEQLKRFEEDNNKRLIMGKQPEPIDCFFIEALKHSLPDCSGVAVGIDRLIMLALGQTTIKEVMAFTLENA